MPEARLSLAEESEFSVQGRYLAAAGNCISCHTAGDGEPFAGNVPFQTPFGTIYSSNITPDPDTGIGRWTKEQFVRAMREGIRADGAHLYPAFPYPAFTILSDEDLDALWAYLRSLPAVRHTVRANELRFPFNQRSMMAVWNRLFFTPGRWHSDPNESQEWNRGAYLVRGLGHCGACHTPRNSFGAEKAELALTGGLYSDWVRPGEMRLWSAPNLTGAKDGLASWQTSDLERYLKSGHSSRAGIFGPMNEVVGNSTQHLSTADIHAMAVYLKALAPAGQTPTSPSAVQASAGQLVYMLRCATCHLPDGLGNVTTGPPLVGNPIVQTRDPATLINIILYGARPAPFPQPSWKSMDGLASELDDTEIANLSNYLRRSWGNVGSPVTPADVARQR
ncbi:mono/diheme cytochrome c family protein [Bradyrhizobium sp. USDA 4461]